MASVDDLDVARITAGMLFGGVDDQQNVFHVLKVSGGTITDTLFMTHVSVQLDALYALLIARQITTLTYSQITGKLVFGGSDLLPDTAWPVLTAGTNGGDALPLQCAGLIAGQTTISRRQGKKYLGAFVEVDNVNGVLSAALLTAIANFGATWIADWVNTGHTYRFGVFNVLSSVFTPFVSTLILGAFRTQRRRTAGFGS